MGKTKFSPEYKARLVIECLKEEKTISEIAAREDISRVQLQAWKKEFLENAGRVFSQNRDEKEAQQIIRETQAREQDLMAKVGRLTVEVDWLKKNLQKLSDPTGRLSLVTKSVDIPIKRQCELLNVNRSSVYYEPKKPVPEEIEREEYIKARIDFWHTKMSYLGVRRLAAKLREEDAVKAGRKLVKRYMAEMGIYCVYPKPNLSKSGKEHKRFPYLLKNKLVFMPNQVWAIDITYIKMEGRICI